MSMNKYYARTRRNLFGCTERRYSDLGESIPHFVGDLCMEWNKGLDDYVYQLR